MDKGFSAIDSVWLKVTETKLKLNTIVLAAERAIRSIEIDDENGKEIATQYLRRAVDSVKGIDTKKNRHMIDQEIENEKENK